MAIVFYVGPRNSYGKKEQNPVYWLKLFLLNKLDASYTWKDASGQIRLLELPKNDWRLWARFSMSFLINGFGFNCLLHILPIQVAGQNTIIGVVFRAVGMIYLVDLDDIAGNTMTLVSTSTDVSVAEEGENQGSDDYGSSKAQNMMNQVEFEAERQKIIQDSVKEFEAKLQALGRGDRPTMRQSSSSNPTGSFLLSTFKRRNRKKRGGAGDEKTSLM